MANFIYPPNRTYVSELQFSSLASNVINQVECSDGKRAGFQLETFIDYEDGKTLIVSKVYDCGIGVKNYNEMEENDIIEACQEVAVKKKLK